MLIEKELTSKILACAYTVHASLGPGLFESVYEHCLAFKLKAMGLSVERQKAIPVVFEGELIELGYRADLVVENKVIVELKSAESITDLYKAQVLTYLRFSGCKVGLLVNFNVVSLKNGIVRFVK